MAIALTWWDDAKLAARIKGLPPWLLDCHGLQYGVVLYSRPASGENCWLGIVNGRSARADTPMAAAKAALALALARGDDAL
jgi:hypothetical protein